MNMANLAASIGIGSARIRISLPSVICPRGSVVRGTVVLEGGIVTQEIQAIYISLVEHWSENKRGRVDVRGAITLAVNVIARPNSREEFPFEFTISDMARLTTDGRTDGWRLAAIANISWALDPRTRIELKVVIHREIAAIQTALEQLGFKRTFFHLPYLNPPPIYETRTHYRARQALEPYLDGVVLRLWVQDDQVVGTMAINHRDSGIAERMKALFGATRNEFQIEIPRAILLTTDGRPNVDTARPWFSKMLDDIIVLPGDLRKQLLRPASRPDWENDRLVRPASASSSLRVGDHLVRPAKNPGEGE